MLNTDKVNDLSNKIREIINNSPLADIEKNINALLRGVFTKMELISREEFDVQVQVLANTKQKLELLEAKLTFLEAELSTNKDKKN